MCKCSGAVSDLFYMLWEISTNLSVYLFQMVLETFKYSTIFIACQEYLNGLYLIKSYIWLKSTGISINGSEIEL